jgi:hypothetical protein
MQRITEVIEIIEKTGDKCIVLKEKSAFVVMKLEDYRKMIKIKEEHIIQDKSIPMIKNDYFPLNSDIKEFEIPEEDRYYPEAID